MEMTGLEFSIGEGEFVHWIDLGQNIFGRPADNHVDGRSSGRDNSPHRSLHASPLGI